MKKKHLNKALLIILAVILSLVVIAVIYRDYKPELMLVLHYNDHNRAILLRLIRSHGIRDMFLFLVLIALFNAIPGMSNSLVCIFTGLCYGPGIGFIINWLGCILGNCIVMSLIRKIDLSEREKKSKILTYLMNQKNPLIGLTLGYMIPIIPSILVNYAVARMNVDRKHFLTMVAIGMAPTSFIYAFGGDAIFRANLKQVIAAAVAIVIILLATILVRKMVKHRHQKIDASV